MLQPERGTQSTETAADNNDSMFVGHIHQLHSAEKYPTSA
jgi:hypothetical protein